MGQPGDESEVTQPNPWTRRYAKVESATDKVGGWLLDSPWTAVIVVAVIVAGVALVKWLL